MSTTVPTVKKGPKRKPPIERFRKYIEVAENGCWNWTGHRDTKGYGSFSLPGGAGHSVYAHRWSYQYFVGPVPEGMEVGHKCGNRGCVNPQHLQAMSHRENLFDSMTSARRNAEKTHCVQGHEYLEHNTIRTPEGHRACKECKRLYQRGYWKKNRKHVLAKRRKLWRETHKPPVPKACCKRGHKFNKKNTRLDARGHRVCRECQKIAMRQFRRRQRTALAPN
jgi:hypothetical protein